MIIFIVCISVALAQNNPGICFGKGCPFPCHCQDDAKCDPTTGSCTTGCQSGKPEGHNWGDGGCQVGNIAYNKPTLDYAVHTPSTVFSSSDITYWAIDGVKRDTPDYVYTGEPAENKTLFFVDLQGYYVILNYTVFYRNESVPALFDETLIMFAINRTENHWSSKVDCKERTIRSLQELSHSDHCKPSIISNHIGLKFYIPATTSITEIVVMGYKYYECPPGKKLSPGCLEDCPDGTFGFWCASTCNCFNENDVCNKVTGYCKNGCRPTHTGSDCLTQAEKVCIGLGCPFECHCARGVCNRDTGACSHNVNCSQVADSNDYRWLGSNCQLGNLALRKYAWQRDDSGSTTLATKANDGNINVESYSETQPSPDSWWRVDLGYVAVIRTVYVYNRDSKWKRLSNFEIQVSNTSNGNYTKCAFVSGFVRKSGNTMVTMTNLTIGRYVGLQLTAESEAVDDLKQLAIVEVVVQGHKYHPCPAGYKLSPGCKQACPTGTYGLWCAQTCHCMSNEACNKVNGRCPGDCQSGYFGPYCDSLVPQTYCFGVGCLFPCNCKDGAVCNRDTGICPGPCKTIGDLGEVFTRPNCQLGNIGLGGQTSFWRRPGLENAESEAARGVDGLLNQPFLLHHGQPIPEGFWWQLRLPYTCVIVEVNLHEVNYQEEDKFSRPFRIVAGNTSQIMSQEVCGQYVSLLKSVTTLRCMQMLIGRYVTLHLIQNSIMMSRRRELNDQGYILPITEVAVIGYKYPASRDNP